MSTNILEVEGTLTKKPLKERVAEVMNRALSYPAVLDVATNSIFAWQQSFSIFLTQRAEEQAQGIWIDPRLEEYDVEEYTWVYCAIAGFTLQQLRAHLDEWLVGEGIALTIIEELCKAWYPVGPKDVLGVGWLAEVKVINPFFQSKMGDQQI